MNLIRTIGFYSLISGLLIGRSQGISASESPKNTQKTPISVNTVLTVAIPAAIGFGWYTYKQLTKPISTVRMGHMPSCGLHSEIVSASTYPQYETLIVQDGSYPWLEIPKNINDERWKKTFHNLDDKVFINQLETLVQSYLKQRTSERRPHELLRVAMGLLASHMKQFELQWFPPTRLPQGTSHIVSFPLHFCKCCQAQRYHLSNEPESNNSYGLALSRHRDGIKISIEVPQRSFLFEKLTGFEQCIGAIMDVGHEMAHGARLHLLHLGPSHSASKIVNHQRELEADIMPTLVLQNIGQLSKGSFFELYIKAFLRDFTTLIIPQLIQQGSLALVAAELQKDDHSHPSYALRIEKLLTAWAAYLIHVEGVKHNVALQKVVDGATKTIQSMYRSDSASSPNTLCLRALEDALQKWASDTLDSIT